MFQLSFLLAMLIFFSVASAKRDDYVLPGIPSLAILFAALFTSLRTSCIASEAARYRGRRWSPLIAIRPGREPRCGFTIRHARAAGQNQSGRSRAGRLFVKYYIGALSLVLVALAFAVVGLLRFDCFRRSKRKHPARTALGRAF